jgi:hypothetical protein
MAKSSEKNAYEIKIKKSGETPVRYRKSGIKR